MIEVVFNYNQHTGNFIFRCKGHAGAAPEGEDLICAAATSHAHEINAAAVLMHKSGWLDRIPSATMKKGKVKIRIHPKPEFRDLVFYMLQMPEAAYDVLASQYPEYVTLTKFGDA